LKTSSTNGSTGQREKAPAEPVCLSTLSPRGERQLKKNLWQAAIVALLLSLSVVAYAGKYEISEIFSGRYAAMKSAMADRDSKAIASLLAPDFVSEEVSGKTKTGEQMIKEVCALPKDPNKTSTTTVLSAKIIGETATVTQRYHMTTTKMTSNTSVKHTVELDTLSKDAWVKSKGVWLLRRTETYEIDYKIDGKTLTHKEREKPKTKTGT
jgi:ketosteroid isomerase-like protein